jgi:hypothetical protein
VLENRIASLFILPEPNPEGNRANDVEANVLQTATELTDWSRPGQRTVEPQNDPIDTTVAPAQANPEETVELVEMNDYTRKIFQTRDDEHFGHTFGDELRQGPLYNYARLGTWSYFARELVLAYRSGGQNDSIRAWHRFAWMKPADQGCGCLSRAWGAFVRAFLLQSVTGWSAFMVSYHTPTVGVGCRSFAILLYNIFSLASCILLISASYISDWISHLAEDGRARDWRSTVLEVLEWGLRNFGKGLAGLNAVIIVLSCIMQFIGIYNNCYCGCDRITLHERGYIVFLSAEQEKAIALVTWSTGFTMALIACLVSIGYVLISRPYK